MAAVLDELKPRVQFIDMVGIKLVLKSDKNFSEFIELIKAGHKLEAVRHARKHLATDEPEHLQTIQKGMALLAFSGTTTIQPYRDLLSDER